MKPTTVRDFFKQFPSDDACLLHLFNVRFGQGHECPKCKRAAKSLIQKFMKDSRTLRVCVS